LNLDEFRKHCLAKPGVTEETPFGEEVLVYKVMSKIFTITQLTTFESISLKVEPEQGEELRERYPSVLPGYHLNKKHWITVLMDGYVGDKLLKKWIDDSYHLVVSKLSKSHRLSLDALNTDNQ